MILFSAIALLYFQQNPGFEDAVLMLSGASDIAEVPSEDLERYTELFEHKLCINLCDRSALLDSGLFSEYQTASILNWISEHSGILSVSELGVVDGFTQDSAPAYGCFVDFSSRTEPRRSLSGEATLMADYEKEGIQAGGKIRVKAQTAAGTFEADVALRKSRDRNIPENIGWNINWGKSRTYSGIWRVELTSVVIGCFNVRLGQGLLCWSGTAMESYSTPSSLMRRNTGIVPYRSWSPSASMCGAAFRLDIGQLSIKPFIDTGELMTKPGAGWQGCRQGGSIAWNHDNGQFGLNMLFENDRQGYSIDFQHTLQGFVLYCEGCVHFPDLEYAALLGAIGQFGNCETGLRLKASAYEHNLTASCSGDNGDRKHHFDFGTTASYFPLAKGHTPSGAFSLKSRAEYRCTPLPEWTFSTRATLTFKSLTKYSDPDAPWASGWPVKKYEIRQDVKWASGPYSVAGRLNGAYGVSLAGMGCLELGYDRNSRTGLWLQSGAFCVDNWDDRLYIYMRDAPGAFSVPALYGRGWWSSAYGRIKFGKHWALYLRCIYMAYPWAREGDTRNKPELSIKLQLSAKF